MRTTAVLIIMFCLPLLSTGQDIEMAVTDPDNAFLEARDLAFEKKYEEARSILEAILAEYPEYSDVQNLLANTYSWEGQHEEARLHFDQLVMRETDNQEIWVAAINNEIYAKNEIVAFSKVNKALEYLPEDPELLALKDRIDGLLKAKSEALQGGEKTLGMPKNETGTFSNNLGVFSEASVFDQVFDTQYGAGIEYQRKMKFGSIIPRISFANRFGIDGIQYELDAYPKIDKKSYAYVNYGYSGASIFPRHRMGVEIYNLISKSAELSVGVRYLDFRTSSANTYTASIGLYKGNYYILARPLITPRTNNPTAIFGSLMIRKYGATANNWIGATLNAGVEPESSQVFLGSTLLLETTRYVEIQELLLEFQFAGKNASNLYKASAGVRHQEFLAEPGSYFWAFTAGIRYNSRF